MAISGYEVHGKENIPQSSGALIVYYHALVPFDLFYISNIFFLERGKNLGGIIHRKFTTTLSGMCEVNIHED